jgi:hypothetical protein
VTVVWPVWRAWLVVHRAPVAWIVVAVVAAVATAFAEAPVPTWEPGTPVPLWGMVPGTVAMLLATTAQNQLGRPWSQPREPRLARLAWAAATAGVAVAACAPVAWAIEQPGILAPTGALTALSLAMSCLSRVIAIIPGVLVDVLVVTFGGRVDPQRLLPPTAAATSAGAQIALGAAMALVAVYAVVGPRAPAVDDGPV